MPKWKAAQGRKKTQTSRARQIGCIFWLALALVLVMWLFYAVMKG